MNEIATTKMSSKGQVVIPEAIRKKLNIKSGTRFVVVGDKDALVLKIITTPSMDQFDDLLADARRQAKRVGLKRKDISAAIKSVRGRE
jgi:AbrB family looped-hinge helix DNA binding protein